VAADKEYRSVTHKNLSGKFFNTKPDEGTGKRATTGDNEVRVASGLISLRSQGARQPRKLSLPQ